LSPYFGLRYYVLSPPTNETTHLHRSDVVLKMLLTLCNRTVVDRVEENTRPLTRNRRFYRLSLSDPLRVGRSKCAAESRKRRGKHENNANRPREKRRDRRRRRRILQAGARGCVSWKRFMAADNGSRAGGPARATCPTLYNYNRYCFPTVVITTRRVGVSSFPRRPYEKSDGTRDPVRRMTISRPSENTRASQRNAYRVERTVENRVRSSIDFVNIVCLPFTRFTSRDERIRFSDLYNICFEKPDLYLSFYTHTCV